MKFMLEFPAKGSPFAASRPEDLREAMRLLGNALEKGTFDCAYSKVGGGGYAVVNSDSIADLRVLLRKLNVHDVNIQPVSATLDVMQGYLDFHESGEAEAYRQKAMSYAAHAAAGYEQK